MRQKVVWFILGVLVGSLFVVSAHPTGSEASGSNIQHTTLGIQKINNKVPVYYIGETFPEYFKNTLQISQLSKSADIPHILVVNSTCAKNNSYLKELVKKEILSGTPVIVVGDPKIISETFKGQFFAKLVTVSGLNGKNEKKTVYGYITYPSRGTLVSKEFISIDTETNALKEAYAWAVRNIAPNAGNFKLTTDALSSGAYWSYRSQLDFTSGDAWKPYGKLNVRTIYYKLINDGSSQYDWYDIHVRQQSVPGKELWNSDWRTSDMYTWIDANYHDQDGFLCDYEPTTTVGTSTVGVAIGVVAGVKDAQVSVSQSWSYTTPDVRVYDEGDYSQELAKWWHDIAEDKAVGKQTYQIEPGATLRFRETPGVVHVWEEGYGVAYARPPSLWERLSGQWVWHYSGSKWVEFSISMG
ncbi:hypothetical protein [Thermococcus sp.]